MPRNGRRVYEMRDVIDVVFDRVVVLRGAAGVREDGRLRARAARRPPRRGDRQPAARPGRLDRRRRRRQGGALHHRRGLVPSAAGLPRRQPGRDAGQRVGEARHPAQRRAHVRGADARARARSSR